MGATLDNRIVVSILSAAQPVSRRGFGTIMHVTADVTFAGVLVKTYDTNAAAQADGELGATAKAAVATLFSQPNNPGRIKVGKVTAGYLALSADLDAIQAEDGSWYGMDLASRAEADLNAAAAWALANAKLFMAQTSDAAVLAGTAGNVADDLKTAANGRTAVLFHADNAEHAALAWLAAKLSADPDKQVTTWSDATLSGISTDSMTDTQRDNVTGKNANVYLTLGGVGATGPGKLASGGWLDELVSKDWLKARIAEAIAQLKLDMSALNRKIPYTAEGLAQLQSVILAQMRRGERIGHFRVGESIVTVPDMADVSSAEIVAREVDITGQVKLTGAVESFDITVAVLSS